LDFLDKALEKARGIKPKTEEEQLSSAPQSSPPEIPPPLSGAGAPVGEIHYTVTRTVPVSPENLRNQRIVTGVKDDPAGEAYKLLRTHIVQRTRAENKNLLMLTGP